jgi:tetratricopeptide (TPR) repeat protein
MADAYNALGLLKAESGDRGEAERQYREAIARRPGFREARHNLALLLAENRTSAGAAEGMWRDILKENPAYLPARLSLAKMLSAQGRDGEAIAEYEQVLRERPDYAGARQALEESRQRAAGRAKR